MAEDSATVENINKTALGGKTGAVNNVEENCRDRTQKIELTTSGSSGSATPTAEGEL